MLRQAILFPVKLPFRVARFAYRSLVDRPRAPARSPEPPSARVSEERPAREAIGVDPRSVQTSPEDIFELEKNGVKVVFVDVREPAELSSGIIEGALLIPSGQVSSRYEELSQEDELVLYCASGMRSTNAAMFLREKGYTKAKSLVGGFSHWVRDGGRVSKVDMA